MNATIIKELNFFDPILMGYDGICNGTSCSDVRNTYDLNFFDPFYGGGSDGIVSVYTGADFIIRSSFINIF